MHDVVLEKLGMQTVDADIITVYVSVGDSVSVGDRLLEIETEKVEMEVVANVTGTVAEILVRPGDTVEVGAVMARIAPTSVS